MPPCKRFESIVGEELYRRLALGEPVVLLDVRMPFEFQAQHIPGSVLIPLHELEQRMQEVPNSGTPIAVICQQGRRSGSACGLLSEHGYGPLFNFEGGLTTWPGPLTGGLEENNHFAHGIAPSAFLVESFDLLHRGLALDLAMGEGRNAIFLATRGFDVDGVDADPQAVARARAAARRLGAPIRATVGNVEDGTYVLPIATYDLVTVFNFLHRPLFKEIHDAVVPGGIVVYETFTTEQAQFGKPRNPKHLLNPGELREAFAVWEILSYRESVGPGRTDGKMRAVAGLVARKPF